MKKRLLAISVLLMSLVSCNVNTSSSSSSASNTSSSISSSSNISSSSSSTISSTTIAPSSSSSSNSSSSTSSSSSSNNSSSQEDDIHVKSVTIKNKEVTTLKVGQTIQLNVEVLPTNATNKILNYSSSNTDIASVSFNGLITARQSGNCIITVSSDDGNIQDTLAIEVISSTVSKFDANFDSSVETITLKNTTFYKLILGKSYPLNVSFDSTDSKDNILEASFSIDGVVSFDPNTNIITPLKKAESVILTLKVRGTNISKEFALKIINEGEKDTSEIVAKLDSSKEKEERLTVSQYDVNLDFNTLDINENRTHAVQSTKFNIHKNGTDRLMIGDTTTTTSYTKYGETNSEENSYNSHIFKGMSDGNYYEYQVLDNGQHLVTPYKKAIVDSVSDSKTQITRDDALTRSTTMIMNSHVGLSEIAKSHFNGLYENSIGFGSIPMYFGGLGLGNLKTVEKDNIVFADTSFIETYPSSVSTGEVYFNHGEYKFNSDGILTDIKVVSYVYDNTYYDFTTKELKENAQYREMYSTEYKQIFGSLTTIENYELNPNNLYFTSYTPVLATKDGYEANKFEIGNYYYISYLNQQPKYADSRIDSIIIDEVSNSEVATIEDAGRSIKIIGAGVCKLTIYSLKNQVKTELYISVNTPSPSSITAKVNGKETDDQITINAGEKLENISFEVLPSITLQDVDVTLEGIGELTKNNNNTYTYQSDIAGKATITATSRLDKTISKTLSINVNEKKEDLSFIDKILATTYVCKDTSMEHSTDITSNRLEFVSSTKAMLYIEANEAQFTYITEYDVTIDETNKTITFNSFNLTNGDYDEYNYYYLPTIKTGIAYKISDDTKSLESKLFFLEDGTEYDIGTLDSDSLLTYYFEAK